MKQLRRTIKIKLEIDPKSVLPTIKAYTKAYNYICDVGWRDQDSNPVTLHHKIYKKVREYLPSVLTNSSRNKASESLKMCINRKKKDKNVSKPKSKQCSIRYDKDSFNIWFNKNICSILTINGRIKCNFKFSNFFNQYINWRRKSAELIIRKNKVFLNICFLKEIEDIQISKDPFILGIDRGINQVAVCSNNKFYSGKDLKRVKRKYRLIRSKLQSKNSQSAKRHLKILSLRENRFVKNENHRISKEIVASAPEGSIIVLEDLKKYRERIKKINKELNRKLFSWSYGQLEEFLKYKSESKGILIDYTGAQYTSQKCSKCGHIDPKNRHGSIFKCTKCGFQLNADLNASRNIEENYRDAKGYPCGLSISKPIVSPANIEVDTSYIELCNS